MAPPEFYYSELVGPGGDGIQPYTAPVTIPNPGNKTVRAHVMLVGVAPNHDFPNFGADCYIEAYNMNGITHPMGNEPKQPRAIYAKDVSEIIFRLDVAGGIARAACFVEVF